MQWSVPTHSSALQTLDTALRGAPRGWSWLGPTARANRRWPGWHELFGWRTGGPADAGRRVIIGPVLGGQPLSRIADEVDCAAGRLAARHGRALAAGDGLALESVAAELASVGLAAAAQCAAAQAESRPNVDNRMT
jgi:hypothetical protein